MRRPSIEIRLLGGLEILRNGRVQPLPRSKKTRALLAYLVVTGRAHVRSHLCDLLWEGPADPRAALRWSLSKIRPLLNDDQATRIVAQRDRVAFEALGAAVDLAAVQEIAADLSSASTDALREAAARIRGEFLEGLEIRRCHRFELWRTAKREEVRTLRDRILATLVQRLRDHPDEALAYARERLLLHPASEAAHLDVVRLLGGLGRVEEALEQCEACRRILARELGTAPSQELEAARRMLRASAAVAPPPTSSHSASTRPPPLIGRRDERELLQRLVAAATAGETDRVLLVRGEPGIGKTRLLEELAAIVQSAGGEVLAGRAFEAEMVRPCGAWIDALRAIPPPEIPAVLRPELAPLLPELGMAPDPSHSAAEGERHRLFEAVLHLVAGRAVDRPVAVVLDDLQWLDETSAALLHFLARRTVGSGVLLACASWHAELADNPAALRLIRALERDGRLQAIDLAPLDRQGTALLVRSVNGHLDVDRIFAESEGNPLLALELARAGRHDDRAISRTLEDLIDRRLSLLDRHARDLVPWAAALGHGFDLDILARVTELPTGDLLRSVEELERRGVLQPAAAGYDFSHDLIRKVGYRRISEPRRRLVHIRIARVLNAVDGADGERAGEIAHHAALGGDSELAARAFVAAARHSLWVFAYPDAADIAERGARHLDRLPQKTRLELHLDLLDVYIHPGMEDYRPPDPEDTLTRLITEARAAGLPALVYRGFHLISSLYYQRGDFGRAMDRALRAESAGRAADPATIVRAIADTARCLGMLEREMARAEKLAREAGALADGIGHEFSEVSQALGHVHHHAGRLDAAVECFEHAVRLAREERSHWWEYYCLSRWSMIELERGRPAAALERCGELIPVARMMGEGSEAPYAKALAALARRGRGEPAATTELDQAVQELRRLDSRAMLAYVQNLAAEQDLAAACVDAARVRTEEALGAAETVDRHSEIAFARALLARLALRAGDRESAARHLDAVRDDIAAPRILSARARHAVREAAHRWQEISTDVPTPAPMPDP